MRRLGYTPHGFAAGLLAGLLLDGRPWLLFLFGVVLGAGAVYAVHAWRRRPRRTPRGVVGRAVAYALERDDLPAGYKLCENPTCRTPMPRTRSRYCSDACLRISRQRSELAARRELDEIPF